MYSCRPNIVLGFHGCDESIRNNIISGNAKLKPSNNNWDWLGNGIYFWEYNPLRALDFAEEAKMKWGKIKEPVALGAVINLGFCLDLTDKQNLDLVRSAYRTVKKTIKKAGIKNENSRDDFDKIIRKLDCFVIKTVHQIHKEKGLRPFDSVRGVFIEGKKLYPTSGFHEKTHIQICVVNPNAIKGYFLPLSEDHSFTKI